MMINLKKYYVSVLLLSILLVVRLQVENKELSKYNLLNERVLESDEFRRQNLEEADFTILENADDKIETLAMYWLESKFGTEEFNMENIDTKAERMELRWNKHPNYEAYYNRVEQIWGAVEYFPVPMSSEDEKATVSYVDTWYDERNYGGKRFHEGTDLMPHKDEGGRYPIISMTDGVVTQKGWLEKGGYRIGVETKSGAYFYYAHLDSYSNVQIGGTVMAGQVLGYMGDTGYGAEGTRGKFPVHLHLGIYVLEDGREVSVNPYWVLRYAEGRKLKYAY